MINKYCLESVASFEKINSAHTNRSKTKQTFSFSKASRFDLDRPNCPHNYYGGEPLKLKRKQSATGIGYGTKYDFTKCQTLSPPSTKYLLKSDLQRSIQKNKGITIANGRDKISVNSYINRALYLVPGPSNYKNQKQPLNKAPIYTMRKKTKILNKLKTIQPQNDNPGPGQYQNPQLKSDSSYASKFSRLSFSSGKGKRFASFENNVPGPNKYKNTYDLSAVGKYIVSSHRGGTKAKFDKSKRIHKFDEIVSSASKIPGPGRYKYPSQFGQYDGDIYREHETSRNQYKLKFD